MKKLCLILTLLLTLVMLCSCGEYVNHYSATMMITSDHGSGASMTFGSFKGTYQFDLRAADDEAHTLELEASLSEGEIHIYIDVDGEKQLLRTVKGGEAYDEDITLDEAYRNAKKIHIILESTGKCKDGKLSFEYH